MVFVDYFEVARELLITLEEFNPNLRILHADEDVMEVALFLEESFEPELISELSGDRLGIGILIGMCSSLYKTIEVAEEQSNEDEEADDETTTQTRSDKNKWH